MDSNDDWKSTANMEILAVPCASFFLGSFYKIAYSNTGRYTTVQGNMVTRHHTTGYFNAHIFSRLGYYLTYSYSKVSLKPLVSVLSDPNQMITVMIEPG